jgi:serine kinase of HPr protein (carbohydrate metabolism regulator)
MSETVHASCVAIGGRGVLISGPSGSGKSDLALRLIDRGAVLVSDDYTVLEVREGIVFASPPETIAGRIEVRAVGIVERPYAEGVPVALLVDLARPPERMPEPAAAQIAGVAVPAIGLSALEGSAPIKVEAALTLHGLAAP